MRISTMTNIHMLLNEQQDFFSTVQCIEACADAGYRVLDLSLSGITQPGRYLHEPSSHGLWLREVQAALKDRGVVFSQAHGVFFGCKLDPKSDEFAAFKRVMRENFQIAGALEIPWMVFHPQIFTTDGEIDRAEIFKANVELFTSLTDLIDETGVGIAIENMLSDPFKSADSLLELLDALDGGNRFGLCWDTGHAHLTGQDQVASIMKMGSKLKATHIADNRGIKDDHLLPFSGTIEWAPVVEAFKNSGYAGDFSFEVHNATKNYPIELRKDVLKLSYDIATYLVGQH
jgi:sugar phosphate isomerase/epimerase